METLISKASQARPHVHNDRIPDVRDAKGSD